MTDEQVAEAIRPSRELISLKGQAKIEAETAELARLEAMDTSKMSSQGKIWHRTAVDDVYWRRRMFGYALLPKACDHQWEEQPGEPPVDVCTSCGERRE